MSQGASDTTGDQGNLLHRRQYVIGPSPVHSRANWKCLPIGSGLHLSHCPFLDVHVLTDADGEQWTLLGIAIESRTDRDGIVQAIETTSTEEVPSLCDSWAGRWMLIGRNRLHLDACGFLACFFVDGPERWYSSSLALLAEVCPGLAGTPENRQLRRGFGLQWFPLPGSRYSGVRALLPTQTIELRSGQVETRSIVSIPSDLEYEDILHEVESSLITFIRRAAERFENIWIGLTAGYDSRLLVATALKANVPFRTFTFLYPGIKLADRKLPSEIARLARRENVLVDPGPMKQDRLALLDNHTCHNFKDRDREFYAQDYWRFAGRGDLVLKAHCFEVARCHFWRQLRHVETPTGEAITGAFSEESAPAATALDEWLAWMHRHPISGMDWKDRFYYEQRLAGWCSADMQANDLVDLEFLVPANSGRMLGRLLAVELPKRRMSRHQVDLIERMAPRLLELPFNNTSSFHPLTRLYWHARYGSLHKALRVRAARLAGALWRHTS